MRYYATRLLLRFENHHQQDSAKACLCLHGVDKYNTLKKKEGKEGKKSANLTHPSGGKSRFARHIHKLRPDRWCFQITRYVFPSPCPEEKILGSWDPAFPMTAYPSKNFRYALIFPILTHPELI
jgi:hypothetical protein